MTTNVVVDINNPKDINNISMFLTEPIFNDCGAALYYSTPPFQTAQFLGYVCNNIPSNTFQPNNFSNHYLAIQVIYNYV